MDNIELPSFLNIWTEVIVYFNHILLMFYKTCKQQLRRLRFLLNEVFIVPLVWTCLIGGIFLSITSQSSGLSADYSLKPLATFTTGADGIFSAENEYRNMLPNIVFIIIVTGWTYTYNLTNT